MNKKKMDNILDYRAESVGKVCVWSVCVFVVFSAVTYNIYSVYYIVCVNRSWELIVVNMKRSSLLLI